MSEYADQLLSSIVTEWYAIHDLKRSNDSKLRALMEEARNYAHSKDAAERGEQIDADELIAEVERDPTIGSRDVLRRAVSHAWKSGYAQAKEEVSPHPERESPVWDAAPRSPTPNGEVTVTTDEKGNCVAVTRTDDEGRIQSVVWQKGGMNAGCNPEDAVTGVAHPARAEAAEGRAKALHEALRHHCMCANFCSQCGNQWIYGDPELHVSGCLAAPLAEPHTDQREGDSKGGE